MSKIRPEPCTACPYRADVPSGVWAAHEYEKLADYAGDAVVEGEHGLPVLQAPLAPFACHATPEAICSGWANASANEGTLALRLGYAMGQIEGDLPEPTVDMLGHAEAALHGLRDIECPDSDAMATQERLLRKYPRLQIEEGA